MSLLLVLSLALPAHAESVTVRGSGDIVKMVAKNADRAVVVKVFGIGKPCEAAQHISIQIQWGRSAAYEARANCAGYVDWDKSLRYLADRDGGSSARQDVACAGFRLTYNADKKFHRAFVPRSCLRKANHRVRVEANGNNFGSTTGGTAGPTRLLNRG